MKRSFFWCSLLLVTLFFSPSSFALNDWERNNIRVFEKANKSVVFISISQIGFDYFNGPQEYKAGLGSGFIWDNDGHIVTNYHVVQGASRISVTFPGNLTVKAELVGAYPANDIAVIKVKSTKVKLYPIEVGNSQELKTGQGTIAIGNPFGLDHSMSSGIVSALGRSAPSLVEGITIRDMIQTDAAINPGNSGGPLLDSEGKLIGMNTQIFSKSGSSSGIGFAVPQKTISRIVPELIKFGRVIRPYLGVDHNPRFDAYLGIDKGVMVTQVDPGSPASKAGIKGLRRNKIGELVPGDIIIKIGEHAVNSFDDLFNALDQQKIGQKTSITFMRQGKKKTTQVHLTEGH